MRIRKTHQPRLRSHSSDHFYPTYKSRLSSSASTAHSATKPFLVGEYDWTNQYYLRFRWGYFLLLLPALLALGVWFMPKRWWPWSFTLKDLVTCGCCRRKRRKRRRTTTAEERGEYDRMEGETVALSTSTARFDSPSSKPDLSSSNSATSIPIFESVPSTADFPRPKKPQRIVDKPLRIHRWMFSLFLLLLALPLFGIIYTYLPTSISPFLSSLSSLETTKTSSSSPSSIGDLYWSLFGRTDNGCQYVQHNDGYTLHYPSDPTASSGLARGSGDAVVRLTKHAWKVRGETPFWASSSGGDGFDLDKLELRDLPVIAFPQEGLKLANGTVVGGS